MSTENTDKARLEKHEQHLRETFSVCEIRSLPNFPYTSLEEVKKAKSEGRLVLGANYYPELLEHLGTKGENLAMTTCAAILVLAPFAYPIASFWTGHYALLFGLVTYGLGFLLSSPNARFVANPLVGILWMFCAFLAFKSPVWAWVVGGFYGGYTISASMRSVFAEVMEERALSSEVFFCYLFMRRILVIKEGAQIYRA